MDNALWKASLVPVEKTTMRDLHVLIGFRAEHSIAEAMLLVFSSRPHLWRGRWWLTDSWCYATGYIVWHELMCAYHTYPSSRGSRTMGWTHADHSVFSTIVSKHLDINVVMCMYIIANAKRTFFPFFCHGDSIYTITVISYKLTHEIILEILNS